jgi:hypothetical protein
MLGVSVLCRKNKNMENNENTETNSLLSIENIGPDNVDGEDLRNLGF